MTVSSTIEAAIVLTPLPPVPKADHGAASVLNPPPGLARLPDGFFAVTRPDGSRFAQPTFAALCNLHDDRLWDGTRLRIIELERSPA